MENSSENPWEEIPKNPYSDKIVEENTIVQVYIIVLSKILEYMTDGSPWELGDEVTVFDFQEIPKITIHDYFWRIMKWSETSSRSLILWIGYIDLLVDNEIKGIAITKHNMHKLILVSTMIASKFYDDHHYDNKIWSKIGNIKLADINRLERAFLKLIKFKIFTSAEEFIQTTKRILQFAKLNNLLNTELIDATWRTVFTSVIQEVS